MTDKKKFSTRELIDRTKKLFAQDSNLTASDARFLELLAQYKQEHPELADQIDVLDLDELFLSGVQETKAEQMFVRLRDLRAKFSGAQKDVDAIKGAILNMTLVLRGMGVDGGQALLDDAESVISRLETITQEREVVDPNFAEEDFRNTPEFITYRGLVITNVLDVIRRNPDGLASPSFVKILTDLNEEKKYPKVDWEKEIKTDPEVRMAIIKKILKQNEFKKMIVIPSEKKTGTENVSQADEPTDSTEPAVADVDEEDVDELIQLHPEMIADPEKFFSSIKDKIRFAHQEQRQSRVTPEEYKLTVDDPIFEKAKPKHRYSHQGADFFVSDSFIVYGRQAFSLLVKLPGEDQYYARIAYKSNSNSVWRTISNYTNGWFGKGKETEESVTFPHAVQKALEELSRQGESIEFDKEEDSKKLFGSLVAWDYLTNDTFAMSLDKLSQPKIGTIGGFTGETPESYEFVPGNEPDFSKVKDKYKTHNQILNRKVDTYIFESTDEKLSYLFYYDSDSDTAWIGSIQMKDLAYNAYGVNSNTIDKRSIETRDPHTGRVKNNLEMPGVEYDSQIPVDYRGKAIKNNYCSAKQYTDRLPVVAMFKEKVIMSQGVATVRGTGLQVPQDFSFTTVRMLDNMWKQETGAESKEKEKSGKIYLVFGQYVTEAQLKVGLSIGRGESSDIQFSDPHVSIEHAVIIKENGNVVIKDMYSTNGTMIKEKGQKMFMKLSEGATDNLNLGDTIKLPGDDAGYEFASYTPLTKKDHKKQYPDENYLFEFAGVQLTVEDLNKPIIIGNKEKTGKGRAIVIENFGLADVHAELSFKGGLLKIKDLSSRESDTFVNGDKIMPGNERVVRVGDKIKLGDYEFDLKVFVKDK